MINPIAASATGTGSALRPFLRGKAGFLLALLLAFLAWTDSQAQQPPPRPGPPPAGPKAQPARPAQSGPLEVDITQGTLKPIPIAVPEFLGEDPQLGREVSDVVAADLERSGLFEPLDRASFIDRARDLNAPPRFQDWRVINAQALVVWNPQGYGSPDLPGNSAAAYYPGDSYVDIVGDDLYDIRFNPKWDAAESLYQAHPSKPFAFPEWAPWDIDDPAFVEHMATFVKTHSRVSLISYYSGRPGSLFDLARKPKTRAAYQKLILPLGRP